MSENKSSLLEKLFESFLWNSRLMILFAVFFTILGAMLFIGIGSFDIVYAIKISIQHWIGVGSVHYEADLIMSKFIGAVDYYLFSVVLMIFGIGLYEIFISNIDSYTARHPAAKVLQIKSLDELKNKLVKVIIVVLIVSLFKRAISIDIETFRDMLLMSGSILLISASLFLVNKSSQKTSEED